jgi:glutamate 5-kinase
MSKLREVAVFKYGSETVANEKGINQRLINKYAKDLSKLEYGLIVVTSGAVLAGRAEAPSIDDDQVLAGLGSADVVMAWKRAFRQCDRLAGQVLATDHEISDLSEGGTLRNALTKDLIAGVVPIFNTNDKLNAAELAKRPWRGENDGPAAHIALLTGATKLCLMTKHNGVFDDKGDTISLVPYEKAAHKNILDMVAHRGPKGQGIYAKVKAAIEAAEGGVDAYIAGASEDIRAVLSGKTGTHFAAKPVEWSK